MKHINRNLATLFTVISALLCFIPVKAADSAEKMIETVAKKLNSAQSLQIHFTLITNGQNVKGEMLVAGNKFYIETPQIAAWHNGQLQWILNKRENEVNLAEPDPAELHQINPLYVISDFKKNYKATFAKTNQNGKAQINVTPKSNYGDIRSASVTINKTSYLPESVSLLLNNGQSVNIAISSLKTGNKVNPVVFSFSKKKYPDAQIIDLR